MNLKTITQRQLDKLNVAIELHGGLSNMARSLTTLGDSIGMPFKNPVTPSQINNWRKRRVPVEMCPLIEELTEGSIKCEDLNSEIAWALIRKR